MKAYYDWYLEDIIEVTERREEDLNTLEQRLLTYVKQVLNLEHNYLDLAVNIPNVAENERELLYDLETQYTSYVMQNIHLNGDTYVAYTLRILNRNVASLLFVNLSKREREVS